MIKAESEQTKLYMGELDRVDVTCHAREMFDRWGVRTELIEEMTGVILPEFSYAVSDKKLEALQNGGKVEVFHVGNGRVAVFADALDYSGERPLSCWDLSWSILLSDRFFDWLVRVNEEGREKGVVLDPCLFSGAAANFFTREGSIHTWVGLQRRGGDLGESVSLDRSMNRVAGFGEEGKVGQGLVFEYAGWKAASEWEFLYHYCLEVGVVEMRGDEPLFRYVVDREVMDGVSVKQVLVVGGSRVSKLVYSLAVVEHDCTPLSPTVLYALGERGESEMLAFDGQSVYWMGAGGVPVNLAEAEEILARVADIEYVEGDEACKEELAARAIRTLQIPYEQVRVFFMSGNDVFWWNGKLK